MSLSVIEERERWVSLFERILPLVSEKEFADVILEAKSQFFQKLGRSHERDEERFESATQSFLEWYLFDYRVKPVGKSPALIILARPWVQEEDSEQLEEALFHHWSLYEVLEKEKTSVRVKDLLVGVERRILYDDKDPISRSWLVKKEQVIQTRLFPSRQEGLQVATHIWLHAESEFENLKSICARYQKSWRPPLHFLQDCLDCLIRSLSLQDQMQALRSANWIYKELRTRHAA